MSRPKRPGPAYRANRGIGARPLVRHEARTHYLRVHRMDWLHLSKGLKTEYRMIFKGKIYENSWGKLDLPTPVVIWAAARAKEESKYQLMVLEAFYQEMLGAISDESIAMEGYDSMDDFRRYWCERQRSLFPPMEMASVFRLRPWQPDDEAYLGRELLRQLYGEWLSSEPASEEEENDD